MNEVSIPGGTSRPTMSSREIAQLTDKEHKNVARDIRLMLSDLGEDALSFERTYTDSMNREQVEYQLDRELTETLLTGYSAVLRRAVIARWRELEAAQAPALPSYAEALRQLATQIEEGERQKAALALAAPKVEFVDRYVESTGNKGFREVCKLLSANEREFRDWLTRPDGPMYRLAGALMPKASHLDAGRFVVKAGASEETGHAFNQAKFTPKGVNWIAGEWAKHKIADA